MPLPRGNPPAANAKGGLRPRDQVTLASMVAAALVMLASYWWLADVPGKWQEFDQAPALTARYAVQINHATWPEFAQLPGIGEKLARRIVAHREASGPFQDLNALLDVHGIGHKKLAAIRPFLLLGPAESGHQPLKSGGAIQKD